MAEPGLEPGPGTLAYIERARELSARLAALAVGDGDVGTALQAVRNVATIDVDAPTTSTRAEGRAVKKGVKRLISWYLGYMAEQVNDLAFALVRLGESLATRADRSDAAGKQLQARLEQLEARVRLLESRPYRSGAKGEAPGEQP